MQKLSDRTAFNIIIVIILLLASSAGVLMAQTMSTITPMNDTLIIRVNNPNTVVYVSATRGSRVIVESSINGAKKAAAQYIAEELRPTYWNYDDVDMIEVKKHVFLNNKNVNQQVKVFVPASIKAVLDENGNQLN